MRVGLVTIIDTRPFLLMNYKTVSHANLITIYWWRTDIAGDNIKAHVKFVSFLLLLSFLPPDLQLTQSCIYLCEYWSVGDCRENMTLATGRSWQWTSEPAKPKTLLLSVVSFVYFWESVFATWKSYYQENNMV